MNKSFRRHWGVKLFVAECACMVRIRLIFVRIWLLLEAAVLSASSCFYIIWRPGAVDIWKACASPDILYLWPAVHFWAPTFKWGISIANIADFQKPPEKISYPQQLGTCSQLNAVFSYFVHFALLRLICAYHLWDCCPGSYNLRFIVLLLFSRIWVFTCVPSQCSAAVTATGVIWSRYSMVITPVCLHLFITLSLCDHIWVCKNFICNKIWTLWALT